MLLATRLAQVLSTTQPYENLLIVQMGKLRH